jgi:peroxiredoxin
MAVPSTMVALGSPLPAFALPAVADGRRWTPADVTAPVLVIAFLCRHCPYVQRVAAGLGAFAADVVGEDVAVLGVSSNDTDAYPDDAPESVAAYAAEVGWRFPILDDAAQDVARAFGAACTPDFFVYDAARRLVYRGQLDAARPSNDVPNDGASLRAAVDAVLAGRPVPEPQVPSLGCSIKWKGTG